MLAGSVRFLMVIWQHHQIEQILCEICCLSVIKTLLQTIQNLLWLSRKILQLNVIFITAGALTVENESHTLHEASINENTSK